MSICRSDLFSISFLTLLTKEETPHIGDNIKKDDNAHSDGIGNNHALSSLKVEAVTGKFTEGLTNFALKGETFH